MASPLPSEVIEKIVESLMWGVQKNRLEKKKEESAAGAANLCGGDIEPNTERHELLESTENEEKHQAKQLNSASRKILREYAAIPLVSRSFRDAYLRFFTTLPALSYDAINAPGEVRLFTRPPPPSNLLPSAQATFPYIVAAPGVVKMLAAKRRLSHLKWVHIAADPNIYRPCQVVRSSPLECLYQLLGFRGSGGDDSSDGHGVLLELDEVRVNLCVENSRMDGGLWLAFHSHSSLVQASEAEWALLNAMGLNATSLHIGCTAKYMQVLPNSLISIQLDHSSPVTMSRSREVPDFSRITRLTLSIQLHSTYLESTAEDWAALIGRMLQRCSGCRELCWEFTDQGKEMKSDCCEILHCMAEGVLPRIESDASILIHINFDFNFEDEIQRQVFFEEEQEMFRLGRQVGDGSSGEMTREIVVPGFAGKLNGKRNDEEEGEKKKAGDLTPTDPNGDDEQQGRRVLRWKINY